jgi:hypothetical protein
VDCGQPSDSKTQVFHLGLTHLESVSVYCWALDGLEERVESWKGYAELLGSFAREL